MAHPKRKHSNTRTNKRRSHDALTAPNVLLCKQCSAPILAHRVCPECGFYKDKVVVQPKAPKKKKQK